MKKIFRLSKSKLSAMHQCQKRLWLEVHRPELRVDSDSSQQSFAIGHLIGDLSRELAGDGHLIEHDDNLSEALRETSEWLAKKKKQALYEATVQHDSVLVRADLLLPVHGGWHLAEVKSSTSVKDYHKLDVAAQTYVFRGAGVKVKTITLRHINRDFIYQGDGEYQGLLIDSDISDEIEVLQTEVPKWIASAQSVLSNKEPAICTGAHCSEPFDCPFLDHCKAQEGPLVDYPVTLLPDSDGKKLAQQLQQLGFHDLRKVPAKLIPEKEKFTRIYKATKTGKAWFSGEAQTSMSSWVFPRYFLDFETSNMAVPIWSGCRPYQQIPFQWSCHIQSRNGELKHREFLDLSGNDPSRAFAESLMDCVGKKGAIISYNAAFERTRIKELATRFDDLKPALDAITARIVDLLPVTREHYYHPDQLGSWSIKNVLPTLAPELDYQNLQNVQAGGDAINAFVECLHADTSDERKAELKEALLRYCERDTLAMVKIAERLK